MSHWNVHGSTSFGMYYGWAVCWLFSVGVNHFQVDDMRDIADEISMCVHII